MRVSIYTQLSVVTITAKFSTQSFQTAKQSFLVVSEGVKHCKRDPRVWSKRASLAPDLSFKCEWTVAGVRKKYDCFAVYLPSIHQYEVTRLYNLIPFDLAEKGTFH